MNEDEEQAKQKAGELGNQQRLKNNEAWVWGAHNCRTCRDPGGNKALERVKGSLGQDSRSN